MCFGCLNFGHLSKSCQKRLTCKECNKPHPSSLHGAKPKRRPTREDVSPGKKHPNDDQTSPKADVDSGRGQQESAHTNANVTPSDSSSTNSVIVPVTLYHKDSPSVSVNVYALLDNASDSTFIKTSILRDLSISGPEGLLQLNTMHGRAEIPVQRIDGLVVKKVSDEVTVEQPKAYSREAIPSRRNQIPMPETASKWPHLVRIMDAIPPYRSDLDVTLLIGCNCPRALKPHEVILGNEDDPYAVRTLLGWGIVGPTNPDGRMAPDDGVSNCHRIVTNEIGWAPTQESKFVINTQTKEIISPFMVSIFIS